MADPSNDEKFDKGKEKEIIDREHGRQAGLAGGTRGQPIGGSDSGTGSGTPLSQDAEFGAESASDQAQPGSGSMAPRSMGTHGSAFGQFGDAAGPAGQQGQSGTGQADVGSQAGSTLSGHADQQDLGDVGGEVDQPASYAGGISEPRRNIEGQGFILQESSGSDDREAPEGPSSTKATARTDFAREGRGRAEDEDEETGEGHPS